MFKGLVALGLSRPRLPRKPAARAPSRLQHVFDALADKHGVCRLDTTGESETTPKHANFARPRRAACIARACCYEIACLMGVRGCHVSAFLWEGYWIAEEGHCR